MRWNVTLVGLAVGSMISGCGKGSDLAGTYVAELPGNSMSGKGEAMRETLVLSSDGTFTLTGSGGPMASSLAGGGTWKADGDKLSFSMNKVAGMELPEAARKTERATISPDHKSIKLMSMDFKRP